jgi:hypothetical protein
VQGRVFLSLRASLKTLISYRIFIFSRENELIYFGKMKILWEISVPKLALNRIFFWNFTRVSQNSHMVALFQLRDQVYNWTKQR